MLHLSTVDGLHIYGERDISLADAERVGMGCGRRLVAGHAGRARRHSANQTRLRHRQRVTALALHVSHHTSLNYIIIYVQYQKKLRPILDNTS